MEGTKVSPPYVPWYNKKNYACTPIGKLKLLIFVIGFVIAYTGVGGLLSSYYHLQFHNNAIIASQNTEYNNWDSGNFSHLCRNTSRHIQKEGREYSKYKVKWVAKYKRISWEYKKEFYKWYCNNIAPTWVVLDYFFVFTAIACLVIEGASLSLGIFRPDLAARFKVLDGAIHAFLGMLIIVGLICSFVALGEKMDDGAEQLIAHAKVIRYEAETRYAMRQNKTKHMENQKEKKELEKEYKQDYDEAIAEAKIQERIPKKWIAFNFRVATAFFGFLNCILYLMTAPMIARGVTVVRFC